MSLANLTPADREVVAACLHAAVDGPFFDDREFATLFGLSRLEVRNVASAWPSQDESNPAVRLAINNAFVNLLGYPHGQDSVMEELAGVDRSGIERVFRLWRDDDGQQSGGAG